MQNTGRSLWKWRRAATLAACAAVAFCCGCATTKGGTAHRGGAVPSIWPVPPERAHISSVFGMRPQPPTGRMRMHNGVDLQCPEGTPVYATADGVVSFSGEQRGYGNIIIVEHANELASVYAHLKKRRADRGEGVRQGQHIGDVGKTGNATTHHLHYEIRHRGEPVDAMAYLPK